MKPNKLGDCAACLFRIGYGRTVISKCLRRNKNSVKKWLAVRGCMRDKAKRSTPLHRFGKRNIKTGQFAPLSLFWQKEIMRQYAAELRPFRKHENQWWYKHTRVAYMRSRRSLDPVYKLIVNARTRAYNFLNKSSERERKKKRAYSLTNAIGCTREFLKQHIERKFYGGMTWQNHGLIWELDHITPLSTASDWVSLKPLLHWTNLQPLMKSENRIKSDKTIIQPDLFSGPTDQPRRRLLGRGAINAQQYV